MTIQTGDKVPSVDVGITLARSLTLLTQLMFFYGYGDHRHLHSFPTRRSSDLVTPADSLWRVQRMAIGWNVTNA